MSDTKAVTSSAYCTILNSFSSVLIPFISKHERIATANTEFNSDDKLVRRGSPCLTPQFISQLAENVPLLIILSNYWMRLSRIWRILQIKEGVIHRGRRPRWIKPSKICRILHILRKPNSIIALFFIQSISSFLKEFRHYALCFSAHQI